MMAAMMITRHRVQCECVVFHFVRRGRAAMPFERSHFDRHRAATASVSQSVSQSRRDVRFRLAPFVCVRVRITKPAVCVVTATGMQFTRPAAD